MCLVSLTGRPLYGLYYVIPFLPYRTLRDHFADYPLGENVLTLLVLCVVVGGLFHGRRLPRTKLYFVWLVFGLYLYISMWFGTVLGNAPAPLWIHDLNFATWKDYMLIPLVFAATGLVVQDRKAIRTVILIAAVSLLFIDRSCLLESMSRTWTNFDEDKRSGGPLGFGSNQTAAFLAQFAMFFWGLVVFIKRKKAKLLLYGLVGLTIFATMYTFSRGAYLALLVGVFILGLLKDRKLIIVMAVFLATWTTVVPTPVRERVQMTKNSDGQLEASAQERVDLWQAAEKSILNNPVLGTGFATYQYAEHIEGLRDTHNLYVKVMVETGIIGMMFLLLMLQQMLSLSFRLFRAATDPLYKGLGLGLFLATCSCIVANCFGDRWTYLEITAMLWVLVATAARALELTQTEPVAEETAPAVQAHVNPFMVYR